MRKALKLAPALLLVCAVFAGVSCKESKAQRRPALAGEGGANAEVAPAAASAPQNSPEELLAFSIAESLNLPTAALIKANPKEFLDELDLVLRGDTDFLLTLVDKRHYLAQDYVPEDLVPLVANKLYSINRNDLSLRKPVENGLQVMAQAALDDGITLLVSSTFRSYEYQEKLFARWVAIDGLEEAERESARAGTSQHQLGTAIDFGSITDDFAQTRQGKWLAANAANYGFSLSFPEGYEPVTGYRWECWHYRYIGTAACKFQQKWFGDIQQYMLEFIDAWERVD